MIVLSAMIAPPLERFIGALIVKVPVFPINAIFAPAPARLMVEVLPRLAGLLMTSVFVTPLAGPLTVIGPVKLFDPARVHVPLSRFAGLSVIPPGPEIFPPREKPKLPPSFNPPAPMETAFAKLGSAVRNRTERRKAAY